MNNTTPTQPKADAPAELGEKIWEDIRNTVSRFSCYLDPEEKFVIYSAEVKPFRWILAIDPIPSREPSLEKLISERKAAGKLNEL